MPACTRRSTRLPRGAQDRLARLGLIEIYRRAGHDAPDRTRAGRSGRPGIGSRPSRPAATSSSSIATGPAPAAPSRPRSPAPSYRATDYGRAQIAPLLHRRRAPRRARPRCPSARRAAPGTSPRPGSATSSPPAPIGARRSAISGWSSTRAIRATWSASVAQGVRRIGPTQFEMRHRNWRPTRDLHVLILGPTLDE